MACSRFASLDEDDIAELLSEKDGKSIKKPFTEYRVHKNLQPSQNATELAEILKLFYAKTRKQDGSLFKVWFNLLQYFWMYDEIIIG